MVEWRCVLITLGVQCVLMRAGTIRWQVWFADKLDFLHMVKINVGKSVYTLI